MQIIDCEPPYKLVKARHGWFLANSQDIFIGRGLLEYGEYCEFECQTLTSLLRPEMDAVEVGANNGVLTVPLARHLAGMGQRLLVVEPQPVVFQNLCANVALNTLFNVQTENVACSDAPGVLHFPTIDYRQENNFGGVSMADAGFEQTVRAVPLDELVPADFRVGLIKVDVEGFELRVLAGAQKTIAKHRPYIYLENDRREHSKQLIEWLWQANYKVWWYAPVIFNPDNFAGNPHDKHPPYVAINMIAFPVESPDGLIGPCIADSGDYPLPG